eukprot:GHVQ01024288.1.p1 GENE.GHVQ01024288.1~~GHVQ01024288.1.p1  ORF type:complete len:548 (+),score=53.96 GHVQ01024288.1:183-1826(+)
MVKNVIIEELQEKFSDIDGGLVHLMFEELGGNIDLCVKKLQCLSAHAHKNASSADSGSFRTTSTYRSAVRRDGHLHEGSGQEHARCHRRAVSEQPGPWRGGRHQLIESSCLPPQSLFDETSFLASAFGIDYELVSDVLDEVQGDVERAFEVLVCLSETPRTASQTSSTSSRIPFQHVVVANLHGDGCSTDVLSTGNSVVSESSDTKCTGMSLEQPALSICLQPINKDEAIDILKSLFCNAPLSLLEETWTQCDGDVGRSVKSLDSILYEEDCPKFRCTSSNVNKLAKSVQGAQSSSTASSRNLYGAEDWKRSTADESDSIRRQRLAGIPGVDATQWPPSGGSGFPDNSIPFERTVQRECASFSLPQMRARYFECLTKRANASKLSYSARCRHAEVLLKTKQAEELRRAQERLKWESGRQIFLSSNQVFLSRMDHLRNPASSSSRISSLVAENWVVDLHGLYVDEAVHFLIETMSKIKELFQLRNPADNQRTVLGKPLLHMVTGIGNNSAQRRRPRIATAVQEYLHQNGYKWRYGSPGVYLVDLASRY